VTLKQHFVSSSDFRDSKEIPWNRIENSTSQNYFSIQFSIENHSKWHWSNTLSVRVISGIRKKSHEIVSRTRLNSSYFSIHFACFFKTNKTLEVTLKQHFVSSSDGEATAEPLYRELDKPRLTSRYNFLSKITCLPRNAGRLEVTLKQHFVSSSDGEATAESLYRELDKPRLTSRYILLVFVKQTKHSKWHWSNTLSVRVISLDSKEISWNRIENSINPVLLLDTFRLFL
jgi:hypothetical protein